MNHVLEFDEARLKVLSDIVVAAGSRLGDGRLMMAAAEMLQWINVQVDAARKQSPSSPTVPQ